MKVTKICSAGLAIIKEFEGLKLKPYLCPANVPTIGYGTTIYPNGAKVTIRDRPITEAEAESFLQHDIKQFELAVDAMTTDTVTQHQFSALVSFCYNLGAGNLKVSTLLKKVNHNPDDSTIPAEFNKWVNAGGEKLDGLIRRRKAEADLYFK